jgi:large subunit ribosomal protein L29
MKASEIRKMTNEEINSNILKLKEELFNLRFQLAVGQLTDTARIKKTKKAIAKLKTVQSELANK